MEHRKKDLTKGKAQTSTTNTDISTDALLKATCSDRKAYHFKLNAALIENSWILNKFKKKEMLILVKFFNTKLK